MKPHHHGNEKLPQWNKHNSIFLKNWENKVRGGGGGVAGGDRGCMQCAKSHLKDMQMNDQKRLFQPIGLIEVYIGIAYNNDASVDSIININALFME